MHHTATIRNKLSPQPELFSLYEEEPGSSPPPCLGEPRGAQVGVLRHTVEQIADVCPFVQILDALVLQTGMGNLLLEVFGLLDYQVPEQARQNPAAFGGPGSASCTDG